MTVQTRQHLIATWLITLAIIMTPWLSFWATPVLAQNQQGETVILCTLNGLQRVVIQTVSTAEADNERHNASYSANIIAEPIAQDYQSCPALQLIKAFSQGLLFTPPTRPNHYYSITFAPSAHYVFRRSAVFSAYYGRAPPFA